MHCRERPFPNDFSWAYIIYTGLYASTLLYVVNCSINVNKPWCHTKCHLSRCPPHFHTRGEFFFESLESACVLESAAAWFDLCQVGCDWEIHQSCTISKISSSMMHLSPFTLYIYVCWQWQGDLLMMRFCWWCIININQSNRHHRPCFSPSICVG